MSIAVGGLPAFSFVNNTINAIYYDYFSSNVSDLEQNSGASSYVDSYVSRWDRLDYTKKETEDSTYFFNSWRYYSEYSMHMYGWYALLPFKDRGFEKIDPYIESLECVHILPHEEDENLKSRILTYLFGLLGV